MTTIISKLKSLVLQCLKTSRPDNQETIEEDHGPVFSGLHRRQEEA